MKQMRWQLLVVVAALVAIALLLVGQSDRPLLTPAPESSPVPEPVTGGLYSEALVGSFGRLNPLLDMYNDMDRDVNRLLYSSLMRFDDTGMPQGDLAESWGISQDGTVYNFSLRSNAVWHDGEPVVSEDVLFTIELMRSEAIPTPEDLREFWDEIDVRALDEETLQFRLPEPFAPFMDYLTFGVLPQHLLEDMEPEEILDAPFNLEPVGSGPYRFDQLLAGDGEIAGVVLVAFDDYYGKKPYIQEVVFQYYPTSMAALDAYREGEVMGISRVDAETLPFVLQEPELKLYTARMPQLTMIYFNLDDPSLPFFQDSLVRKALLMGLNRRWMVDRVYNGQAILADGPIFPNTWAHYEGLERVEYQPEAAIDLLREGGYLAPSGGDGIRVKDDVAVAFELVHPVQSPYPELAEAVQRDWERLGVRVSLKAVPFEEMVSDYLVGQRYEAALVSLNLMRSPDPDPYPFWHQSQIQGGQNYAGWDDRQASEYLEQARVMVDPAERARRYRNFQVRFAAELPALPLFYPVYSFAVDEDVQDVTMGPLFDTADRFDSVFDWNLPEAVAGEVPAAESTAPPAE